MWNVSPQPGMATAVVDFTADFSPLLMGLISVVSLSAAMILYLALRHYLTQKIRPDAGSKTDTSSRREAA